MVLFTEGGGLVQMSFMEDADLLWCPDNDGQLVDIASCLEGSTNGTATNGNGQNGGGGPTTNTQQMVVNSNGMASSSSAGQSATAAAVLAAMEHLQQQQQQQQQMQQNDSNNNISSSSSQSCTSSNSHNGGGGVGVGGPETVHCDLANLDSLEGEPEEILRQLAENPFEIEYFFSDMPGVEVKEEITDMVGYDDSTAYITSSFTPSSPGLPASMNGGGGGGGGGVSTTTGNLGGGQGRYSISANSLLAGKLMAASSSSHNNNNNDNDAEDLMTMGQQRPAGKPPDPNKGEWGIYSKEWEFKFIANEDVLLGISLDEY